jgi:putative photosynthetic complex assembly protein 2
MSFLALLGPFAFAVFLWWFVTGLIFFFYGRPPLVRHLFFGALSGIAVGALVVLVAVRGDDGPTAVYLALTGGIFLWGWQVASYYLGYITGPLQKENMPSRGQIVAGGNRFWLALQASLHHELAILAVLLILTAVTWQSPNKWGLYIFLTLWLMHSLAKINVFLGVRNFRIEYLPEHLHFLSDLLPRRENNPLLMGTVFVGTAVALGIGFQAINPLLTNNNQIGPVVVATIILLGVLEHLLLILPLRSILWGWGIKALPPLEGEITHRKPPYHHVSPLPTINEQVAEG